MTTEERKKEITRQAFDLANACIDVLKKSKIENDLAQTILLAVAMLAGHVIHLVAAPGHIEEVHKDFAGNVQQMINAKITSEGKGQSIQ